MGGVDGDGRQQRIDFTLIVVKGMCSGGCIDIAPLQHADAILEKRRTQVFCPAAVLIADESVHIAYHVIQGLPGGQAIEARFGVPVFNALHDAGHANFDKLIQITGGNGQEFNPFQQGIAWILGFFEDTAIKAQPRLVAADKETLRIFADNFHSEGWDTRCLCLPY